MRARVLLAALASRTTRSRALTGTATLQEWPVAVRVRQQHELVAVDDLLGGVGEPAADLGRLEPGDHPDLVHGERRDPLPDEAPAIRAPHLDGVARGERAV